MRTYESFYKTTAWRKCRDAYFRQHTLCEECLKEGKVTAGVIVHHKQHISRMNMNDPNVLLNHDNLETLCVAHHNQIHYRKSAKRYDVDQYGHVMATGV